MRRPVLARDRHFADRIVAMVILVVALILVFQSLAYGLFEDGRPGPGLFPMIVAVGLAIAAACWIVAGAGPEPSPEVRAAGSADPRDVAQAVEGVAGLPAAAVELEEALSDQVTIDRAGARRIAFVVAWTAVPLLLMDRAGYIVTITIYVAGLLIVIAKTRRWLAVLATAVGSVLTAWGADALGIILPDPFLLLQHLGL